MTPSSRPPAPIFIVGLPRSGSTLLSRLLNETADIFSFNDLYYLQLVFAEDAVKGALTTEKIKRFIDWICRLTSERSSKNNSFLGQFTLPVADIEKVKEETLAGFANQAVSWDIIMDTLLSRLATLAGKSRWADKTPQNFRHLPLLSEVFPEAFFLFLFRDPRHILASFKYADGKGHDRRRYHPLAYSLYWRSAVRKYRTASSRRPRVAMIRYEDITEKPHETIERLNTMLQTTIQRVDLAAIGDNTSFAGTKRQTITATEQWICQKICGPEMAYLDYSTAPCHPRFSDLPELIWLSLRFSLFQGSRLLFSRNGRKRITLFIQQLLTDPQ